MKYDYARLNVQYNSYVEIALESFLVYRKYEKEVDLIKFEEDEFEKHKKEHLRDIEYIKCVVFSAMSIEGFIYDISAIELGDSFVEKHMDKLSPIDKIVLLIKCIDQRYLDESQELYQLLVELFRTRNILVHSKTLQLPVLNNGLDEKRCLEYIEKGDKDYIDIKKAIKVLFLLNKEIHSIKNAEHYFPYMLRYKTEYKKGTKEKDIEDEVREIIFS